MTEANTELKLPKNYKRPSLEEFTGPGHNYPADRYEEFFKHHEERLAEAYASGELTDEMFDEELRLRKQMEDEMADRDNDGLPDVLHVKSQVRAVGNRTLRARHPTRHRFKQYLFGNPSLRLVRKRVLRVSAAQVRVGLDELIAKEAAGILSVHAPNGARIDLAALKAGQVVMAQLPPTPPLPNKPLDSVANDIPAGENMAQYLGGTFAGDPIAAKTAEDMAAGKAEEAERKQPADLDSGTDPLDPAGAAAAPVVTDGEPASAQEGEASLEAPPVPEVDPALAATEVAEPPAPEPPASKDESSKTESSARSSKKGGRK